MKRSISLFLIGLFTVGLVSLLGMDSGFAQRSANDSTPAEIASFVSSEMADGWMELHSQTDIRQSSEFRSLLDAESAVAIINSGAARAANAVSSSTLGNVSASAKTVIVYRWDSIPWKKLALRWVVVLGFTWLIGNAANNSRWNGGYWLGAVLGSVGFFLVSPLYINHIPHWPFATLGSSLPELGSLFVGTSALNPITASALIPFLMLAFLLGHPRFSWMTVGVSVGVAALLALSVFVQPSVLWIGSGFWARLFLAANALFSLLIAYLSLKTITDPA